MWPCFKRPFTYEGTSVVPHHKALFIDSQFIAHWDFSVKRHIIIKSHRMPECVPFENV